jgi:hypothetical protein
MTDGDSGSSMYPGWYDKYGKWWETGRLGPTAQPDRPKTSITCTEPLDLHGPCLVREDIVMPRSTAWRTYCHEVTADRRRGLPRSYQGRETPNMGRLVGHRSGDAVPRLELGRRGRHGFVRDDGNTMTAQPHSISTPRRCGRSTTRRSRRGSPNVLFNEMATRVRRSSRTTERAWPVDRHRRTPERGSGGGSAEPPPPPPPGPTLLPRKAAMGEKHIVRFEPSHRDRGRRGPDDLRAAAEQGVQPHAARGRPVRGVQVVRPRGRYGRHRPERYSTTAC